MKLLKIDSQTKEASFKRDDEWVQIIAIEKDDLVSLIDYAATEDEIELDECTKSLFIKDETAKTIYENIYKVLKDLVDNREDYIQQYKEEFEVCKAKYRL